MWLDALLAVFVLCLAVGAYTNITIGVLVNTNGSAMTPESLTPVIDFLAPADVTAVRNVLLLQLRDSGVYTAPLDVSVASISSSAQDPTFLRVLFLFRVSGMSVLTAEEVLSLCHACLLCHSFSPRWLEARAYVSRPDLLLPPCA